MNPWIIPVYVLGRFKEEPVTQFHDAGFVDGGDFFPAFFEFFERILSAP
jgi:hypothetical protein